MIIASKYKVLALAFVAGMMNVLAFSPFDYWLFAPLSFAVLFTLWLRANAVMATAIGFFFGLGMFGVGISWIYVSVRVFGEVPAFWAASIIFILIVYLSLYPALCGWLQRYSCRYPKALRLVVIMPTLWIMLEWVRGQLFTGFPWLASGYVYLDTALSNYAPIGGVYLVGFLALASVGALLQLSQIANLKSSLVVSLLLVAIWGSGWQLNQTAWTQVEGEPIKVALIQNNVPITTKWDRQASNRVVQSYVQTSWQHLDTDLIVWPEIAIPGFIDDISADFWADLQQHPADFIFGALYRDNNDRYYNSAVSLPKSLDGQLMLYRKQHLVPFGEYLPLQDWLGGLLSMFNIAIFNLTSWQEPQQALIAANSRFATSICYEDSFPNEWRQQVLHAGALLNISEDGWFGDSLAPHQRLQMSRFRARESERFMVRAANTGLSAIINWKGSIVTAAPQFVSTAIEDTIQPRGGVTPYTLFGDKIALYFISALLLIVLLLGRKWRKQALLFEH